jgi:hypothetical protein
MKIPFDISNLLILGTQKKQPQAGCLGYGSETRIGKYRKTTEPIQTQAGCLGYDSDAWATTVKIEMPLAFRVAR